MDSTSIANRYLLQSSLGAGGMGEVYRALDRLSGHMVALKRLPNIFGDADDTETALDFKLALTREFRVIASLRHPHIISVFDYGFDAEGQPFFTMELLSNAQNLRAYAHNRSSDEKIALLVQLLQGLHYLHRRGIIHRDLKPENVLLTLDGRLRILDFGLAQLKTQSAEERSGQSGTLFYISPEVAAGEVATPSADLYTVGAIAYELFAGQAPFTGDGDVMGLFEDILNATPDVSRLGDCPIVPVIARLLAKTPQERYSTASATIRAIGEFVPQHAVVETAEYRESFLQAAEFVGRERELTQLIEALVSAKQGHGQSWLIGGESGVGKSRLLDELRIQALVQGFQVLRGQAIEGGGLPYQLWREPLRRLVLSTTLSELEAGVLKEIVPDIGELLGRVVANAPRLDGKLQQERLQLTIVDVLKQQTQPTLLLLEDLQWTQESLEPLKSLQRSLHGLPLCVVGNYRSDERPNLAQELSVEVQVLRLERLPAEDIAALSSSMLGEVGAEPQVVELLQRETEGNVFFLVEVVRALAEEAGELERIGRMTLPRNVLAGGVQQVIQRRLAGMPAWGQPLLKLAAVSGRELNLEVLACLDPQFNLEFWLNAGAEAAIFEVRDERWRFSHDKLREIILGTLNETEKQSHHKQVAAAIERIYPNSPDWFEVLFEHWQLAGDSAKEIHYSLLIAEQLLDARADIKRVQQLVERSLELNHTVQSSTISVRNHCLLGKVHERLGNYALAEQYSRQGLVQAQQMGDLAACAEALQVIGLVNWHRGTLETALQVIHEGLEIAQEAHDRLRVMRLLNLLGIFYTERQQLELAIDYFQRSLAVARELAHVQGSIIALSNLGDRERDRNPALAKSYYQQAQDTHRHAFAQKENILLLEQRATIAYRERQYDEALSYLTRTIDLYKAAGEFFRLPSALALRGVIYAHLGQFDLAWQSLQAGVQLVQKTSPDDPLSDFAATVERALITNLEEVIQATIQVTAHGLTEIPSILEALVWIARWKLIRGNVSDSALIAGLVAAHSATSEETKQLYLHPLLKELGLALGPEAVAAAQAHGATLDLMPFVRELSHITEKQL